MKVMEDKMLKGFNAGYLIQKFEPELAQVLVANLSGVEIPYIQGFLSGTKQFVIEKELEKSDIFPGMDADFDLDISDKDLDQNLDLGKDNLDIDI